MKKDQQVELKKWYENISNLLVDETLSTEERNKLETIKLQIAGSLMRSWLPAGIGRKLIMAALILVVAYFVIQSMYLAAIVTMVLLCLFSPRVVGEATLFMGRLNKADRT
jgi:VIT1/CCC1 family predicted Fe2+/Mn2+ transporter